VDEALPGLSRAVVTDTSCATRRFELPLPCPGADDGLLRVEATGVCGTDWEIFDRGPGGIILGQEIVGRVAALGERAAARWGVRLGDRIAVEPFPSCGACGACRRGDPRRCRTPDPSGAAPFPGYGRTPVVRAPGLYGGFSDYLYLHPRSVVHAVGEQVEARTATLFAPLAGAVRRITRQARTRAGDTVVVLGACRQGLACVPAARHAGAGTVVVAGPAAQWQRLHAARHLGADEIVFADEEDAVAAVRDITGGRGAETVVHLLPGPGTLGDAVAMTAVRGTVVLAAPEQGGGIEGLPYGEAVRRELRLVGARGHDHRSVETALDVIRSRRYPLHLLTTHHFPVVQAEQALRTAAGRTGGHVVHVSVGI
jgi:threonine dehydrogenase-like Zn-dependent dehydrogenase